MTVPAQSRSCSASGTGAASGTYQYTLSAVLIVVFAIAVLLALWRMFDGRLGVWQLGLLAVAGISALAAVPFGNSRWLWFVTLAVGVAAMVLAIPGPAKYGLAVGVSGVYLAAGIPVVIATRERQGRWPWVLGSIGCFAAAALFTPADPASMLVAVVPASICYALVATAWRIRRSVLVLLGSLLFVGAVSGTLGGYAVAYELSTHPVLDLRSIMLPNSVSEQTQQLRRDRALFRSAGLLAQICTPIALLGVAAAVAGLAQGRSATHRKPV